MAHIYYSKKHIMELGVQLGIQLNTIIHEENMVRDRQYI